MQFTISSDHIIYFASLIAAIGVIWKVVAPAARLNGRVAKLEKKQAEFKEDQSNIKDMMEESKLADRLLVKAMVEIIDNRLTDNNIDGLRTTKKDLMEFLKDN